MEHSQATEGSVGEILEHKKVGLADMQRVGRWLAEKRLPNAYFETATHFLHDSPTSSGLEWLSMRSSANEGKNNSDFRSVLDASSCRSRHTEGSDSMQLPRWKDNQDYARP
jgi:hypothetical protein